MWRCRVRIQTMARLRVSAISFLNTAPLMWDFDHGDLRQKYQVDYTLPSACAELLRQGMADIGIIPVATYASIPGLVVIPDIAIAAKGPVKSILLVSPCQYMMEKPRSCLEGSDQLPSFHVSLNEVALIWLGVLKSVALTLNPMSFPFFLAISCAVET